MRKPLAGIRRRLSYANVAATLALFMAMGGTAYAAATIGSADIVDNSIQSADVKNGALTSLDMKNENLQGADVKDGTLTAADLAAGSVGTSELFDGAVTAADIADGTITLADLGASARGVSVQPFVTVIPAGPVGQTPTVLATEGLIRLVARCVDFTYLEVETASVGGVPLAGTSAVSEGQLEPLDYDHDPNTGFIRLATDSQFRAWGVVTSTADERAMLFFLGASVALNDEQCAFDGFAIGLR